MEQQSTQLTCMIYSFGFKHGVPIDAHILWDVRFLPNPYWQEHLRSLSGCDPDVSDFVVKSKSGQNFLELLKPLILFHLENQDPAKKQSLRIAIGCTGGRHRSVAVVESLARSLKEESTIPISVFHRDMERE